MAEAADHKARLKVLGGFELVAPGGKPVAVSGRKAQGLLAILALSPGMAASRDRLAGLLWSDRGDAQARNSLRQALVALRKELGDGGLDFIEAEREQVRLVPERVAVDAVQLAQLASEERPTEAATLYDGPLLDGIHVRDDAFEEWARGERQRLADLAFEVQERVYEATSGPKRLAAARKLLTLDPLREAAHRAVMEALAQAGERDQALRQYEVCRDMLIRELGTEPSAETQQLKAAIMAGGGVAEAVPAPAEAAALKEASAPALSERPSIAVLPFTNMSGDPEQEYFSDGITEDIITELSRSQSLFVIARNSSFLFKGQSVDIAEVGAKLGVRYVVEGSVRKAGKRVRITAQLVEAETRNHLWADRYDRDLEDLFAVQDEVTERIAWALVGKVGAAEFGRTKKTQKRLDAYDQLLRGIEASRRFTRKNAAASIEFLKSAISLEPDAPIAHAWLAEAYATVAGFGEEDSTTDLALQAAQRAIELGDTSGLAEAIVATICGWRRQFDAAEGHLQRALTLGPTHPEVLAWTGYVCMWNGQLDKAREIGEKLRRLDPLDQRYIHQFLAFTYYLLGDYHASLESFHRWNNEGQFRGFANLAACLGQVGRIDEAKAAWARCLEFKPGYSIEEYKRGSPYRRQEDLDHWLDGLCKAGVGR